MGTARKRSLSPSAANLPLAKRREGPGNTTTHALVASGFETLYDELILHIFSHLSYQDLCVAQVISRDWFRLASDNHLWRLLYIRAYGRTRLRGARGFVGRTNDREIRNLPSRAKTHTSSDDLKDWKWMFRISSNWRRGRCNVQVLHTPVQDPSSSVPTNILIAGPLILCASPEPSLAPSIFVSQSQPESSVVTLECPSSSNSPVQITALALDQSPHSNSSISVVVFLSNGEFIVYQLNLSEPAQSTRKLLYTPLRTLQRSAPIIQSVYHHPLLASLSQSFSLNIYDLSNYDVRHIQTLTSFTSFPPTSFSLSTPAPNTYKLVMAYSIPVYPAHWSIGATELVISNARSSVLSSDSISSALREVEDTDQPPLTVVSTRSARAIDVPHGFMDSNKLRSMREQWSRKVPHVADIQTDGKWIVLAPAPSPLSSDSSANSIRPSNSSPPLHSSTTLQLYRLTLPSTLYRTAAPPKIAFVRYLEGQTSPVSSLALADGRCVSLGMNGSIWVWDLENGTGAQVSAPLSIPRRLGWQARSGSTVFDDRRIITADSEGVVVRRFDI
ncbi:hypothetical protein ONZ45_g14953 [Pleurotus djamor]|nr:hypothetical protein ONZ45_g14953 [Pleurotus djamor]